MRDKSDRGNKRITSFSGEKGCFSGAVDFVNNLLLNLHVRIRKKVSSALDCIILVQEAGRLRLVSSTEKVFKIPLFLIPLRYAIYPQHLLILFKTFP
jgi:hypothetical protein